MEKQLNICKLINKDLNSFCIILSDSDWNAITNDSHITFKILEYSNVNQTSGSNEWQGKLQIDDLKNSANELEMQYEDFLNECKLAFCTDNMNMTTNLFSYYIKNNSFVLQKNEIHKCTYIEMNIEPTSNLKDQIVLDCLNIISDQNDEIKESNLKLQSVDINYQATLQSYQKCVEEKNNLEKNLLIKFAALLNSKKDKIAELQATLWDKKNTFTENSQNLNKESVKSSAESNEENTDSIYSQPTQKLPKRKKLPVAESVIESGGKRPNKPSSSAADCSDTEYDLDEIYNTESIMNM